MAFTRIGQHVLGKTAVSGIAAELRLGAHRFEGGKAVFAVAAGRVEPGNADAVASFTAVTPGPAASPL
jgi:hypothetical protein